MQTSVYPFSRHSRFGSLSGSYGHPFDPIKRKMALVCTAILFFCLSGPVLAGQNIVIAAFGDSLTAGYQLSREDAFPARLEQALRARGYHVRVLNAGVSGDTTGDALARLDWTLGENVDAVIVEFGANDALRGLAPSGAKKNLDAILTRLAKRRLPVLLAGMAAPRNLGAAYGAEFNRIYPELARRHKVILFPFFLDGVITVRENLLADGLHPNPRGVAQIVQNILPYVEKLIRAIPRP